MQQYPKLVPSWTDPLIIGRHAFGDQYRATDFLVPGKGKLEVKWTSEDGRDEQKYEVFNFPGPGIALSMYNLDKRHDKQGKETQHQFFFRGFRGKLDGK